MNNEMLAKYEIPKHFLSLDIETTGVRSTSKIASIGAAYFDIQTGEIESEFYVRCDLLEQLDYRTDCKATLDFWKAQRKENPESYKECFDQNLSRLSLKSALMALNEFASAHSDKIKIVTNGPEFDAKIIANAMEHFNIQESWRYNSHESLRTFVTLGRLILDFDPKYSLNLPPTHHALGDAINQAKVCSEIYQAFTCNCRRQTGH